MEYKWHCKASHKRFKTTMAAIEHALSTEESDIYPVYGESDYGRTGE